MSKEKNPFDNLPALKETITRIARVPSQAAPKQAGSEIVYVVKDETNGITYKLLSRRRLTAGDIRRALVRAFARTDSWPEKDQDVEIRI